DGSLDRRAISQRVFGGVGDSAAELSFLESITHPRIGHRLSLAIDAARQQQVDVVIVDAAVMIKAGWDKQCDYIVFVDTPRELRLQRVVVRGWTENEFAAREAAQTPVEIKRQRADWIVDNSASLEETFRQVKAVWHALHDKPSLPVTHLRSET
ncbi:MAG: dephospho-CoA kinase, partial [Planctomycetales bacterium]|nr:dephospho-CoA kinase [Planctomycetales bacterium]